MNMRGKHGNQLNGVLSLFDGMSCGQLALQRAGVKYKKYYASEINKQAIKTTQLKFPKTIQLGDVRSIKVSELSDIDLVIGGSPCTGFSYAGKKLNFEDPQSKLFFEFVRILEEVKAKNPNVLFLLENVNMPKKWQDVISSYLKVEPIRINSALVSAQNRDRLYWTNIDGVDLPNDKYIFLKDILEDSVDESYVITKSSYMKHGIREFEIPDGIIEPTCIRYERSHEAKELRKENRRTGKDSNPFGAKQASLRIDGKTNCLTHVQRDNLIIEFGRTINKRIKGVNVTERGIRFHRGGEKSDGISELGTILFDDTDKSDTVIKSHRLNIMTDYCIRRLTPIEVCRLQTVPDDYFFIDGKQAVTDNQIYDMCGNGWTIDVISHVFSFIFNKNPLSMW